MGIATAAVAVLVASLVAIVGLVLLRKTGRPSRHLGDNDVAGPLFGAVGV